MVRKATLSYILIWGMVAAICNPVMAAGLLSGFSTSDKPEDEEAAIFTRRIIPLLVEEARSGDYFTIRERMEFYETPGMAIAVIDNGRIKWSQGFGVTSIDSTEPVTDSTLFQAASISKPVAAAAALLMVREDELHLDRDINETLQSWKLSWNRTEGNRRITLRHLLSHTGGLSVHGFPGYAAEDELPSLIDILNGSEAANTDPVEVVSLPGSEYRYSGGGYVILQQMMTDAAGVAFPELLEHLLLRPAGMKHSSFDQAFPGKSGLVTANAHVNGKPVAGGYNRYPEMAAAGLWTTAADLARLILSLQKSASGEDGSLFHPSETGLMTTPVSGNYGLGLQIEESDYGLRFRHSGTNYGFHADMVGYLHQGKGAVVMTNSDNGHYLVREVIQSIAEFYRWPDYPIVQPAHYRTLPAELLESYSGTYEYTGGHTIEVVLEDKQLYFDTGTGRMQPLFAYDRNLFFSPMLNLNHIRFSKIDDSGHPQLLEIGPDSGLLIFTRIPD